MNIIDMHCDTLSFYGKKEHGSQTLFDNEESVSFKRMAKAKAAAQFFAMWMPVPGEDEEYNAPEVRKDGKLWDEGYIATLSRGFRDSLALCPELVAPAVDYNTYLAARTSGRMAAFLTLEDGRAVDGEIANLKRFHDMGVGLISLTWNHDNCFGHPNSTDPEKMRLGLTYFGKEAVEAMFELGMITDVSHLSDGGFSDVADIAGMVKKPFVASHSNARAVTDHPRNMTDAMIRKLADCGGVMGLNFCSEFLTDDGMHMSRVNDMVRHILHIRNVGGSEILAFGSDLDGIGGTLEVGHTDELPIILTALKKAGLSDDELDRMAFKNVERVLKDLQVG